VWQCNLHGPIQSIPVHIFCRSIRLDYPFVCQHDALSRITLLSACNCHLARLLGAFPSLARPFSTSQGKLDCSNGTPFLSHHVNYHFRSHHVKTTDTSASMALRCFRVPFHRRSLVLPVASYVSRSVLISLPSLS